MKKIQVIEAQRLRGEARYLLDVDPSVRSSEAVILDTLRYMESTIRFFDSWFKTCPRCGDLLTDLNGCNDCWSEDVQD